MGIREVKYSVLPDWLNAMRTEIDFRIKNPVSELYIKIYPMSTRNACFCEE